MRDINRIDEVMSELTKIWKNNPDWRFGQLISNVIGEIKYKGNISDIFFPEDDFWREKLKEFNESHDIYNHGQNLFNK